MEQTREQIRKVLEQRGPLKPATVWACLQSSFISRNAVKVALSRMAAAGEVQRLAHGVYALSDYAAPVVDLNVSVKNIFIAASPGYLTAQQVRDTFKAQHGLEPALHTVKDVIELMHAHGLLRSQDGRAFSWCGA